jgi:PIN domain nuclease of toxin-antitoxin system
MAIKVSLQKLTLAEPIEVLIPRQLRLNGIDLLGITVSHMAAVSLLPLHHRDPFDRMLIAQSQVEHLSVVSIDRAFDAYGIARLW